MKVRIQCKSVEHRLTGRNNDHEYVYHFEPEMVFGQQLERLSGSFSFSSQNANLFHVGVHYEISIV